MPDAKTPPRDSVMTSHALNSVSSGLVRPSKAPRSLQNRNTKNLSLEIQPMPAPTVPSCTQQLPPRLSLIHSAPSTSTSTSFPQSSKNTRPLIAKRRTDAVIYSINGIGAYKRSSQASLLLQNGKSPNDAPSLSLKTRGLARTRAKTISGSETSTPIVRALPKVEKLESSNVDVQESDQSSWLISEQEPTTDAEEEDCDMLGMSKIYKKNTYANGPLLVISPNVFLYSEPSLEEITDFDIVLNVAEEIIDLEPELPNNTSIEYRHIKWSHNTKIINDLEHLTDIINKGVLQHKKVLVHCQCGVSRSASLIVAYLMRFQGLNLNDAYNKLKVLAPDISPNMSLIFQLMEWGEKLGHRIPTPKTRNADTQSELQYEPEVETYRHPADEVIEHIDLTRTYPVPVPNTCSPYNSSIGSSDMTPQTPIESLRTTTHYKVTIDENNDLPKVSLTPKVLEDSEPDIHLF